MCKETPLLIYKQLLITIWSLVLILCHPAGDAENGRQQGEDEIPKDEARQQAVFSKAFGGAPINDHLRAITQEEENSQHGEIIGRVRRLEWQREGRRKEK